MKDKHFNMIVLIILRVFMSQFCVLVLNEERRDDK